MHSGTYESLRKLLLNKSVWTKFIDDQLKNTIEQNDSLNIENVNKYLLSIFIVKVLSKEQQNRFLCNMKYFK